MKHDTRKAGWFANVRINNEHTSDRVTDPSSMNYSACIYAHPILYSYVTYELICQEGR